MVNLAMESLHTEERGAETERYSSTYKLLLEYREGDSERVWSAKHRAQLEVGLG